MRKARFAEWLLQSVTTPERAASTAGDLLESVPERGNLWFWCGLVRTAASHTWCGFTSDLGGLVLRAWGVGVLYFLGYLILRASADIAAIGIQGHAITGEVSRAIGIGATFVWQLLVGRWIARRAPGRSLSAAFALWMYSWAVTVFAASSLTLAGWQNSQVTWLQFAVGCLMIFPRTAFFLVGAFTAQPRRAVTI